MKPLRLLGYLWSLPYGLVGLLAAGLFLALGWVELATWRTGALELVCRGPFSLWIGRERGGGQRWTGFTLGWTIFYWGEPTPSWRIHEHRHVDQALVLGVFMPLVWGVSVVLQGYRSSVLERDARRAAGQPD